ncbi:hypothetical protein B0T20DRAFT_488219 [Sordaria brevicollis]|uniref:Ecp2 effector protein domain-containing protein n=1 Tax=Sordaria brevicollis TaxID=83679 RepID=A0AAE0P379_SORBR|nr:hypothetical protein B0T20DRAFT_488219 [Sordaria brevicollis]
MRVSTLMTVVASTIGLANATAIPANTTLSARDWPVLDATAGDWSVACTKDFDPPADNNHGTAVTMEIYYGINYLRTVPGQPEEHRNVCGRVSCSWKSAIYWCNEEKDHGLRLASYGDIADGAQAIMDKCEDGTDLRGKAVTSSGDGKKWSVVVVKAKC